MGKEPMHKVLVVDDEAPILELLTYNLKKTGYEVMTAVNGLEALEVAKKFLPDLVLLDIMMPVMDGYEMLRQLKDDSVLKDIPVIAVTARARIGDDMKCMQAGASDYIPKPIDLNIFVTKMAKWL